MLYVGDGPDELRAAVDGFDTTELAFRKQLFKQAAKDWNWYAVINELGLSKRVFGK